MTLREGPQALDAQRLGRAAEAMQLALLQSEPPAPGGESVIRVFPAWPKEWDARFPLSARGGFVVTAAMRSGGRTQRVELASRRPAATCQRAQSLDRRAAALLRPGRANGLP